MALAVAQANSVDILVAAEQNIRLVKKGRRWLKDAATDVAILAINRKVKIHGVQVGRGFITLDLGAVHMTCAYISPNCSFEEFSRTTEAIMSAGATGKERIVLGDINAHSPLWGSSAWDNRGELWADWANSQDLEILNDGKEPTWRRGTSSSFIDVTLATRNTARVISGWRVMPDESLSDHGFIIFDVGEGTRASPTSWNLKPAIDPAVVSRSLRLELANLMDRRVTPRLMSEAPKRAQGTGTVKRRGQVHYFPYWWDADTEAARRECIAARNI